MQSSSSVRIVGFCPVTAHGAQDEKGSAVTSWPWMAVLELAGVLGS